MLAGADQGMHPTSSDPQLYAYSALFLLDSHLRVQLQWRSVWLFTLCSWYLASWGAIWCSHLRRCLLHLHPLPGPEESGEVRGTPSTRPHQPEALGHPSCSLYMLPTVPAHPVACVPSQLARQWLHTLLWLGWAQCCHTRGVLRLQLLALLQPDPVLTLPMLLQGQALAPTARLGAWL